MLRVRPDDASQRVALAPFSPRAFEWLEGVLIPLGGEWETIDGTRCCLIDSWRMSTDLLASSGLELMFGPARWDTILEQQGFYH